MPFLRSLAGPILASGGSTPTVPPPTEVVGWEAFRTSLEHDPAFDRAGLSAAAQVLYDRTVANMPGQQYGDPVVSFVANHAYSKNLVYTIARRGGPEIASALNLLLSTGNGTPSLASIQAIMAAARGHWQPNSSGGMLTFFDSADLEPFGNDDMNFVQYRLNLTVALGYYGAGMDALDRNRDLDAAYASEADLWFDFFHNDMREYWYNRPGLQDGSADPGDYLVVDRHFPHCRWSLINFFDCMARACDRRGRGNDAAAYRAERDKMFQHERGRYVPYQDGWFASFSDSSPTNYFTPAYYYGHAVWHMHWMAAQGYGFSLEELGKITWVVPNKLARPVAKGSSSDSNRAPLSAHDGTEAIFGADIGGNQASSDAGGDSQWELSGTTLAGDSVTLTSAPASHDQYSSTGDNLTHTDYAQYNYGLAGLHHADARDLNEWVYATQFGTSMSPSSNRLAGMQLMAMVMTGTA